MVCRASYRRFSSPNPPSSSSAIRTVVLLVSIFALLNSSAMWAAEKSHTKKHDIKKQVELLEEQWRKAQLGADLPTLEKMLADDYIGISMNGQVNTKAQQLDRIRTRKLVLSRLDLSDMKVKLLGAVAIVTCRADVEGTSEDGSVKGVYRYTRIYQQHSSGEWKITSFEATRVSPRNLEQKNANIPANPKTSAQQGPGSKFALSALLGVRR